MPLPQGRGPYNAASGNPQTDNLTYNPQADARADAMEYSPELDEDLTVGARGADNQPTGVDAAAEDRITENSDRTGSIPRSEISELQANRFPGEGDLQGRTRGKRVDAFKQERQVDEVLDDTGVLQDDKEIEIGRATGR